jgi:hypothetical protein
MNISKRTFFTITIALSVLFLSYFYSTVVVSDLYGNLLSPLNAFAADGILFYTYMNSDRKNSMRVTFLLYSLACFAWGISDTIWAIMEFMGGDPMNSPIVNFIYFLPNILILAALGVFASNQLKNRDFKQFASYALTVAVISLALLWIVFFNMNSQYLKEFLAEGFIPAATIITDLLFVIIILTRFLSNRKEKIPRYIGIMLSGVFMYGLIDIYYFYLEINEAYIPNSLIDSVYMFTFQVIAFGALWNMFKGVKPGGRCENR